MVYIVTLTMQDGRSLIQGVYGSKARADKEAARIQATLQDMLVTVTETQIID